MERFQFLKTYADSINQLAKADESLAKDLLRKIMQYWIYDENIDTQNPIIEAMFVQIKVMLDNGKELSNKNKENWKKWWRPKKQKETETKPNQNPNETDLKAKKNPNESETKAKKNKIENRKEKKENIKEENKENNNLKVISDTEQEYGNPEINLLIDLIKSFNWWIIDWTIKEQRQYGYLLLQKLKKLPSVEEWKFKRNEVLETILRIISQSKYHSWKIVSTEKIFRNLTLLMQECKKEFHKAEVNSLVITTI